MSTEFDYLSIQNVHEAQRELALDTVGLEHLEVSVCALEALQVFFDTTPNPSIEQLALADVVMDNVTAGTDLTPEDVVPSLESYVGTTVATENLKDTIVKYYHQIIAFIKRMYDSFIDFMVKFFDDLEPLKEKLENLIALLDELKSANTKSTEVMVGPSLRKLAVNYKLPVTYRELFQPLRTLHIVSREFLDTHANNVSKLSKTITATRRFNERSEDALSGINDLVTSYVNHAVGLFSETVADGGYQRATPPLFNNRAIFLRLDPSINNGKNSEIEFAAKLQNMAMKVDSTESDGISASYGKSHLEKVGLLKMEAMSPTEIRGLTQGALEIVKEMIAYRRDHQNALEVQAKESQRAANEVAKVLTGRAKLQADGSEQITDLPSVKALLGYHSAIAKWSIEPFTGLMLYNSTTIKTLYMVLTAHVANLE